MGSRVSLMFAALPAVATLPNSSKISGLPSAVAAKMWPFSHSGTKLRPAQVLIAYQTVSIRAGSAAVLCLWFLAQACLIYERRSGE